MRAKLLFISLVTSCLLAQAVSAEPADEVIHFASESIEAMDSPADSYLQLASCDESCDAACDHHGAANVWCRTCGGGLLQQFLCDWNGNLDVGVNGAAGNSEFLNAGVGFDARREFGVHAISLDTDYLLNRSESSTSIHRMYTRGRYERRIPGSDLSWYLELWHEYDQFRAPDSRLSFSSGLGSFADPATGDGFRPRFGLGSAQSASGGWAPEIQLGFDWDKHINNRHRLFTSMDFYPTFDNLSEFRLNIAAGWEMMLDDASDLRLRFAAFDRYDTDAIAGYNANDIDYLMSLVWGF